MHCPMLCYTRRNLAVMIKPATPSPPAGPHPGNSTSQDAKGTADSFGTPLMRQYGAIKKEHPNALLFFRLGDFYELFFEDAVVAARELQITLTSRNKEKGAPVPMCGVPYHAAQNYLARLLQKGYRVAICDQVEDPRLAKKLVKREVTRVVTPGTTEYSGVVTPGDQNYLTAVYPDGQRIGLAYVDLSTGEFRATEFDGPKREADCQEELGILRPREILLAPETRLAAPQGCTRSDVEAWTFAPDYGSRLLAEQFGV